MGKLIVGLDLMKFLMALGIVAIHCHLSQIVSVSSPFLGVIIGHFTSLCVPGFFIVSSFLFFRKCDQIGFNHSDGLYFHFIKRLITVYFFYFVLLSPIIVGNRGWFSMGLMGFWVFIEDILLRYTYPGSWFMSALVLSTTIIWLFARRINTYWLIIPLWLFDIYVFRTELFPEKMQVLFAWYEENVRTMRLSFPAALFPICIGSVMGSHRVMKKIESLAKYEIIVLVALIVVLGFNAIYELPGFSAIEIILLFIFFYNLPLKESPLFKMFRSYSVLFFFWHFIVLQIIKVLLNVPNTEDGIEVLGIPLFFIVLAIITMISSLILYLEKKKFFMWLKYSH